MPDSRYQISGKKFNFAKTFQIDGMSIKNTHFMIFTQFLWNLTNLLEFSKFLKNPKNGCFLAFDWPIKMLFQIWTLMWTHNRPTKGYWKYWKNFFFEIFIKDQPKSWKMKIFRKKFKFWKTVRIVSMCIKNTYLTIFGEIWWKLGLKLKIWYLVSD